MANRVGQQFGSYRLLRFLGDGGFAEVYLREHIHLGTPAAIKVLHARLSSQDEQKFLDEARTIARLIHPHIVRFLDFGIEGQTPFLIMDYASHGTLLDRHPLGTPVQLNLVVAYVRQVADALHYAHNKKIIHRDIKPENLFINAHNTILLADFGIAAAAHSTKSQVLQDKIGTISYMAPEQIQGYPLPASDQYSLGIVTYTWLMGALPFHGALHEIVAKHLHASPPPMRQRVPPLVELAVFKALQKDPKQRFGNIKAFASALEQASTPTVVAPPPPPAGPDAGTSVPPTTRINYPPSPPVPTRRAGRWWRRHNDLQDATVAWSPDGQYIAVSSSGPGIKIWKTVIGDAIAAYNNPDRQFQQLAWSPDGQWLAATTNHNTIELLIPSTGKNEFTYGGHFDFVRKIAWA